VAITVTAIGGTSATTDADLFTYVAIPTVTSIAPAAGPLGGGTPVVITGTDLAGTTAVAIWRHCRLRHRQLEQHSDHRHLSGPAPARST